jgi:hypothetical protein
MDSPPEIKHVLLYASLRPGSLMLAECADGALRLLRDDRAVDGAQWEPDQVGEAAAAFHRMAAQAQGKGN